MIWRGASPPTTSGHPLLLQAWSQFIPIDGVYEVPSELSELLPHLVGKLVFFSVVWGIGGSTDTPSRKRFNSRIRELVEYHEMSASLDLPEEGLVYDYAVDVENNRWIPWMEVDRHLPPSLAPLLPPFLPP